MRKARSDWRFKIRIFFAIHLQAAHTGFMLENNLIVAGLNELKSTFFLLRYHTILVYTKTTIHLRVAWQ